MNQEKGTAEKEALRNASVWKTLLRILVYLKDYRLQLVLALLMAVVTAVASVGGTYLLRSVINDAIVPLIGSESPDFAPLIRILTRMGAIYLMGIATSYFSGLIMVYVSSGMLLRLRIDMFSKVESLPIGYFDSRTHGEIMSHFTNDAQTMREMVGNSLPNLINSLISIIGVVAMMIVLSWKLFLLVLIQVGFIFLVVRIVGGRGQKYYRAQQTDLAAVNGYAEEYIEGQKVVKVFSHEAEVKKQFDVLSRDLFDSGSESQSFSLMVMPILANASYVHYALTAMAGAVLTIHGMMDIGTIGSFLQYTRNFTMPINNISQQLNAIFAAVAGAERIFSLLDERPEIDDGGVELVEAPADDPAMSEAVGGMAWRTVRDGKLALIPFRGDVRFHDVTFSYVPGEPILKNVSLYAKPGQKIAFVGSTGAGKTTVINLITRFYDVDSGMITIDGIDIREIRKDSLRSSLGMVLQDTHLFTGTVMENIRYGRLAATDAEVIAAAKAANADSFIRHLPDGYQTMIVNDGMNLSQGQRQLLAIARAAVADPPILILDEATSSIDTRTEMLISRAMDRLMENRTVFVIAHRLSTVRNSNAIIVLEHGEIIERGDHQALIDSRGRYYRLSTGQAELA